MWYGARIVIISTKSPRCASWHSVGSIPVPAEGTSLSRWLSSTAVVCFNYKAPVVWSFDTLCHLTVMSVSKINPLNAELNPICHLLALLGARLIFHVSRIMVNYLRTWCITLSTYKLIGRDYGEMVQEFLVTMISFTSRRPQLFHEIFIVLFLLCDSWSEILCCSN
jgi:hypothetical protein